MRLTRPSSPRYVRPQAIAAGGFTLVELAITLVVLSVLMAMAAPLFTGVTNGNRLTSNANEIVAALQIARSEALRRNARTLFCQSSNGTSCSNDAGWEGWLVYADANGDNVVDPEEIVRSGVIEQPIQIVPSSNITLSRVTFRADGLAYNGNTLLEASVRICLPVSNPALNARDVSIAVGGRIAVRAPVNAAGACPAPGNT
jgi:type IV fimbrial biogenesis protein FimT